MKKTYIIVGTVIMLIMMSTSITMEVTKGKYHQDTSVKVVVSLSIVGDWVSNIAGQEIEVQSIVSGLENPHTYDPDPSEIAAVASADLFIQLGLEGLEPWVKTIMQSEPSLESRTLTLINTSIYEYMEYDEIIEAYNPHVWMSPIKVRSMCTKIYDALANLDPLNNETYYNNLLEYQNDLFEILNKIDEAKKILKGQYIVVNHPSFLYLFDLLGIERLAVVEEKEGSEPSAAHIAEITQLINEIGGEKVLIINQPQMDIENIQGIAEATGAKIVEITPLLGVVVEQELEKTYGKYIDSYIEMLNYDIDRLESVAVEGSSQKTNDKTTNGYIISSLVLGLMTLIIIRKVKRR